jgi:hypothetical protein
MEMRWSALRNEDYGGLPGAGEPTIGLPMPAAHEPPTPGRAVEREQAHEIDCDGGRLNIAGLSSRADIENSGSALAPDNRDGHGSPFPRARRQSDGAAKG